MGRRLAIALLALAATGAMPAHSQPGARQARVGVIFNALPMSQLQAPALREVVVLAYELESIDEIEQAVGHATIPQSLLLRADKVFD